MASKAVGPILLILAIFCDGQTEATVSSRTTEDVDNEGAMSYSCLHTELFTLHNQSTDYAIAECSPAVVCNQARACTPGPCGLRFSYVNSVDRAPDGDAYTSCCHLNPEPDGQESCTTIQVQDKHYLAHSEFDGTGGLFPGKSSSPQKPNGGQTASNAIDMPKTRALQQARLRRRKRRGAVKEGSASTDDIVLPADVWVLDLHDRHAPYSYLKKIENTPSGYTATFCTIQCSSSTSTVSTRPTTKRQTQQPTTTAPARREEKKETGHKKGLFNGHGCFSGEMIVETSEGAKRMDQLHVGDRVRLRRCPADLLWEVQLRSSGPQQLDLQQKDSPVATCLSYSPPQVLVHPTTDSNSDHSYQPIEWFYHRDPNQTIDYINLKTRSGHRLSITANHLIPFVPCIQRAITSLEMDRLVLVHSRFASRSKLGRCLAVKSSGGDRFVADQIVSIRTERKRGVYSPITEQGTMIVNGVQTSCYSSLENQAIQKSMHSILIKVKIGRAIWDSVNGKIWMEEKEIPKILKLLLNIAEMMMPSFVYK